MYTDIYINSSFRLFMELAEIIEHAFHLQLCNFLFVLPFKNTNLCNIFFISVLSIVDIKLIIDCDTGF
jgi:hypothetical protein